MEGESKETLMLNPTMILHALMLLQGHPIHGQGAKEDDRDDKEPGAYQ